jgi:hypothetical protein
MWGPDRYPVSAAVLRGVQCLVRVIDQGGGILPRLGKGRDADADRDAAELLSLAAWEWVLRDHLAQDLSIPERSRAARFRNEKYELLAAIARGESLSAGTLMQQRSERAQQVVAGEVAVRVVVVLEVVDIEEQERELAAMAPATAELLIERLPEESVVVQPGQTVAIRHVRQLRIELLQLFRIAFEIRHQRTVGGVLTVPMWGSVANNRTKLQAGRIK